MTTYPDAVRETCAWLVGELERGRSWDGTYLEGMLDYAAEDAALRAWRDGARRGGAVDAAAGKAGRRAK